VTGDWQKFKGLPGAEGTLRGQPAKVDKRALYEAALASVGGADGPSATTPKRKAAAAPEPTPPPEPTAAPAAAEPAAGSTTAS